MTWIEDKKIITERYFEVINANNLKLFEVIKPHINEVEPILPLIEFIIERLETVTILTTDNRIWDAEIVLRSAIETFVKLVFITSAEKQEQERRIYEYWNLLAEVNSIKQSEQAKKNLKNLGHIEEHKLAHSPVVLPEELEKKLKIKWTKAERQKLEQKWSFTEMVHSISKNYRGTSFEIFESLAYSYRMSSHVTHGDETGILIIRERDSRPQKEREIAYFAHYLRLLSDCSTYCAFIAIETMSFLSLDKSFFFKNLGTLNDIQPLIEKYHNELFNDKDYDKYRDKK